MSYSNGPATEQRGVSRDRLIIAGAIIAVLLAVIVIFKVVRAQQQQLVGPVPAHPGKSEKAMEMERESKSASPGAAPSKEAPGDSFEPPTK